MITINTKSWHYKMVTKFHAGWKISSLCQYMRWLVLSLLILLVITTSTLICAIGAVTFPLMLFSVIEFSHGSFLGFTVSIGLAVWAIALVAVAGIVGNYTVGYFMDKWYDYKYYHRRTVTKEKEPSLVVSYLKAKKQKICPMIEFK